MHQRDTDVKAKAIRTQLAEALNAVVEVTGERDYQILRL